jgi:diguanylate cyclase (GGDEF)-like protein
VQTRDDDRAGPSFSQGIATLLVDLDKQSCIGVPIILEGRVWGEFFAARSNDETSFLEADLPFAHVVAAQVAAAIAQVRHMERVAALAYTDPLTGLGNRRAIDDRLDRLMDRHRADGTVASLIVVDVNGLKRINDEYGHEAGDRALIHFAGLLSASAGLLDGCLAGRTGGDEFCIIVEGHDADSAVAVAEDLCRRARISLDEGIACGVASTDDPVGEVDTPARLFRLADAAQTRAKRSRTSRPVVAGRGLPQDATVRLANRAERSPRTPSARGRGDRRRVRAQRPVQDSLLGHVLTTLDHSGTVSLQARLEIVADAVTRSLDACSWWVSRSEDDVRLKTLSHSFVRVGEGNRIVPEVELAGAPSYLLDTYPLSRRMLAGGGYVVMADDPVGDPAEVAMLTGGGYSGLVMAGGRDAVGRGWLVEVYVDDLCGDVAGMDDVLRALVATALMAPPG